MCQATISSLYRLTCHQLLPSLSLLAGERVKALPSNSLTTSPVTACAVHLTESCILVMASSSCCTYPHVCTQRGCHAGMCRASTCRGLQVTNQSSEIADDRPSAACEFSPDGTTLATGAWSGLVKLWSLPDCQKKLTIKAHDDRVTGRACQLHCCKL